MTKCQSARARKNNAVLACSSMLAKTICYPTVKHPNIAVSSLDAVDDTLTNVLIVLKLCFKVVYINRKNWFPSTRMKKKNYFDNIIYGTAHYWGTKIFSIQWGPPPL